MKPAGNTPFAFRLPDEVRQRLEAEAARLGVKPGELARAWILERLDGPPVSVGRMREELTAVGAVLLAALSDQMDLDEARTLVRDHYLSPAGGNP